MPATQHPEEHTMHVGQILRHNFQADVYQGEYMLVEDLGGGKWVVENLPPSEELIEAVYAYVSTSPHHLGYFDPFGPGRREMTRDEAWVAEIEDRMASAGRRSTVQFVSRAAYAAHF
jgi:hypothetical protein